MIYSPGQFEFTEGHSEEVTISKVQDLQISLEQAMSNITELQANLTFMIKYNEEIKEQWAAESKRQSQTISELQAMLLKRDSEVEELKLRHDEYESLIFDTKEALAESEVSIEEKDSLIQRQEKIIQEQKRVIGSLEEEVLASKYNEVSMQSNQSCYLQIEEAERELEELKYQNKRLQATLDREAKKCSAFEKENAQFKSWLGEVAGVKKVITGCESVIMGEITRKLREGFM